MIVRNKFWLLMLFFTSGCIATKYNMVGCYELKNNKGLSIYYYLKLNKDSTYYFLNQGDMDSLIQEGRWQIKRNNLILNSYTQPNTYGYFNENHNNNENRIKITLYDFNKNPLSDERNVFIRDKENSYVLIHLKENTYFINQARLPSNFTFGSGYGYNDITINLKDPKSNVLNIYLVPNTKGFFQKNKKLTITGSRSLNYEAFHLEKGECI